MSAAPAPRPEPAATPQCMLALEHANRIRLARAALKRAVASGDADTAQLVVDCPWEIESMAIGELLRSQRSWGRTRTRRFLASLGIGETRPVASLTERQRAVVATALRERRAEPTDPLAFRGRPALVA